MSPWIDALTATLLALGVALFALVLLLVMIGYIRDR